MGCTASRNVKTIKERSQKFSEKFNNLLKQHNINLNKSIVPYLDIVYDRNYVIDNGNDNIANLICPICYDIINNPISCSEKENSHSFCKECINSYFKKSDKDKCPMCKNNFEHKTNKKLEDELSKLSFQCIYNKEGCNKIIPYKDYFKHIYICKYSNYLNVCKVEKYNNKNKFFVSCDFKGNNSQIEEHFKKCALFEYNCSFCNKTILRINLKEHMEKECKKIGFLSTKYDLKYAGECREGKSNGYGIYFFLNKIIYEGESKDGLPNGLGILYYSDTEKYVGEFKDDYKDGYGCEMINNMTIYNGYFKKGKRDGFGVKKGEKYLYRGEFKEGKYNGLGYCFNDGEIEKGFWVDDTLTGFGIIIFNNGDKYIGDFINDITNGIGILYFARGDKYEGEFSPDLKKIRYGTYYYKKGGKYTGEFVGFNIDGYGIRYYEDGTSKIGKFYEEGILKS